MVDKFKKALDIMVAEKGAVRFFGIFKMDEITDRWTILISASWSDENTFEVFSYINNRIKALLTEDENSTIARLGIFTEDEHLIELLLNYKVGTRIIEERINGNIIYDGYVLASNKMLETTIVPL